MKSRIFLIASIVSIFFFMIVFSNVRAQYEVVDKTEEYFGTDNGGNCHLHYAKAIVTLDVTEYTNPSSPNYGKLKIKFNRNIVSHNLTEQGSDLHEVHFEFCLKVGENGNWVSKKKDDVYSSTSDDAAITTDYTYWYENWGTSNKTVWIKVYVKSACCPGAVDPCSTSTGEPFNMYAVTNPEQKVINDSWVVPPIPEKIFLEDAPLDFGTDLTEKLFKVKNSGGKELDWQASENYDWITGVNPGWDNNLTHNQYTNVTVTIDRSKLNLNVSPNEGAITVTNKNDATDTEDAEVDVYLPDPATPQNLTITNAGQQGQFPQLSWNSSGDYIYRYYIYRKKNSGSYQNIGYTSGDNTTYTDTEVTMDSGPLSDDFYYKVRAQNGEGYSNYSNEASTEGMQMEKKWQVQDELLEIASQPENYGLSQSYPNPFNPRTIIRFQMPEAGHVLLSIVNLKGQVVQTLLNQQMSAGFHEAVWNGKGSNGTPMPSGIYIYKLQVADKVFVRKMTLMK